MLAPGGVEVEKTVEMWSKIIGNAEFQLCMPSVRSVSDPLRTPLSWRARAACLETVVDCTAPLRAIVGPLEPCVMYTKTSKCEIQI